MKLRASAGLICCAALLGLPAVAGAKPAPIKTTTVSDDGVNGGLGLVLWGHLTSPNKKCLAGRTVKLFFNHHGSATLADTDLTSANGIWGVTGDNSNFVAIHVKVTRKIFGPPNHRRVCARSSTQIV